MLPLHHERCEAKTDFLRSINSSKTTKKQFGYHHRQHPACTKEAENFGPATMKGLFHRMEAGSSSDVGKKDRKLINKKINREVLGRDSECKIHKCKNKSSVILLDGAPVLFFFNKKYFPTIRCLGEGGQDWPTVYLDDGAVGPISRGADVMAPGIYKYRDMVRHGFEVGDAVVVRIIGKGVVAVGEALLGLSEITAGQTGAAIEVYHRLDDALHRWR
jgi:predicted RNA-binding protein (TIGR00451 family)